MAENQTVDYPKPREEPKQKLTRPKLPNLPNLPKLPKLNDFDIVKPPEQRPVLIEKKAIETPNPK